MPQGYSKTGGCRGIGSRVRGFGFGVGRLQLRAQG